MNHRIAVALVTATLLGCPVSSAIAGPCTEQIAEFERTLQEMPGFVGTAPQSVDAQLEHQPTPASVENAKHNAKTAVVSALAQAKSLDAQGNNECADALAKAKLLINP
jgi:hypothetical protein